MAIIDRIKFDSPSNDVLVWKFRSRDQPGGEELRLGSQLIVNQSQEAVFVKGGVALDVFGPGTHTLSTGNIPLLRKLIDLPFGGQTPFTAEVWYVNKTVTRDRRWGTPQPIVVIDPIYNFPVSVRAFGTWGLRIDDSRQFVGQIVGTLPSADADMVEKYFVGEIVQRLSDALARLIVQRRVSVFQISTALNELARATLTEISAEFGRYGVEVVNFNVESINIPDEEKKKFQEILGKRMEIEQISGANVGQAYVTMRTFDTLERAAANEGGAGQFLGAGLGLGVGLGAGAQVGQQLSQGLQPSTVPQGQPPAAADPMTRLKNVKQLLDAGLLTQEEFEAKKREILGSI